MRLLDAQIEKFSGFPVIPGNISIGAACDNQTLGIPNHNRLLMVFRAAQDIRPDRIAFWPVIDTRPDASDFYEVDIAQLGIEFAPLSAIEIGQIQLGILKNKGTPLGDIRLNFQRRGANHVRLVSVPPPNERRITAPKYPKYVDWSLLAGSQTFEVTSFYSKEGLNIKITGRFGSETDRPQAGSGPTLGERTFAVGATIPWEILKLKDFASGRVHFFQQEAPSSPTSDTPERLRDSRKLGDLLYTTLNWVILPGCLRLRRNSNGTSESVDHSFLELTNFGNERISFSVTDKIEVLGNGFSFGLYRGKDSVGPQFSISVLGRRFVEEALRSKNSVRVFVSGEQVGLLRYRTGYANEPADPLGSITQAIRSMSLAITLDERGLTIGADGELSEFDPEEFKRHKEERKSQLTPYRSYSLAAVVPWAFLVVREFGFVLRARNLGFL